MSPGGQRLMAARLDIRISKDSDVTIRQQLTGGITFLIVTGQLRPGDVLPSVRDLARRLKIHHNTVSQAYGELEALNLLFRRRGSPMVVRSPGEVASAPPSKDLDDLINATVRAAQENGYNIQQLRQRVQERLMAEPPDHVLVVSSDDGIRQLLREELRERLRFPVETCSPDDLSFRQELVTGTTLVVGPAAALSQIVALVPKDRPAISITFSSGGEQLEMVRQLREPSHIALVSISEFVLQTARGVLAPVLGQRHTLREYLLPQQNPGSLGAADLVICDMIARRRVEVCKKLEYRLISPACLEQVARAMEP